MNHHMSSRRAFARWMLVASLGVVALPTLSQPAPTPGGVLNAIVAPEPPGLNLALQQVAVTQMVSSKIYESLIVYSQKLEPTPGLARAWSMSADRLTYTFQLQKGVKWHDGQP